MLLLHEKIQNSITQLFYYYGQCQTTDSLLVEGIQQACDLNYIFQIVILRKKGIQNHANHQKNLHQPYVIAGIIVFLLLFFLGLYSDFSAGESLFGSAVLAVVGMVVIWWQREGWW